MNPTGRQNLERVFSACVLCAPLIVLCAAAFVWRAWSGLPALPTLDTRRDAVPTWPTASQDDALDWSVFRAAGRGASERGALAGRYRLAGTFVAYGASSPDDRKAVLDDRRTRVQSIVAEGDELEGAEVARILRDRVVLRGAAGEETLWLSFTRPDGAPDGLGSGAAGSGGQAEGAASDDDQGEGPFGSKRVGENSWVFRREAILDYYTALRDQPERLVALYDSMKNLYDESGKTRGYHLDVEGEGEFWDAVGLQEGDTVTAVNSMPMTSRRRAEYFIREFVQGRANAFVLDVERGGEPVRLVYQAR